LVVESPRSKIKVEGEENRVPQVVAEEKIPKDTVAALGSITELQNYQIDCFRSLLSV